MDGCLGIGVRVNAVSVNHLYGSLEYSVSKHHLIVSPRLHSAGDVYSQRDKQEEEKANAQLFNHSVIAQLCTMLQFDPRGMLPCVS